MKKFVLIAALALLASPALAADQSAPRYSVKAPAPAPTGCTVMSCIGFFVGGTIEQAGGNFDIIGTGINGLAQNGFGMGGQIGYEFFSNNFYFAGLGHVETDLSLNAIPGTSFSDRMTWGGCARIGYSLAGILGAATTGGMATTPTLPQQLLNSLMTPYVNVCEDKRHGQPAIATGGGIEALIAANTLGRSAWTLNADYLHYSYNQGGTAGTFGGVTPIAQTDDNLVKVSLNYHFSL